LLQCFNASNKKLNTTNEICVQLSCFFLNYIFFDCITLNGEAMSADRFDYLADKIKNADFSDYPFQHICIENFLSDSDFKEIITSDEINVPSSDSDENLFDNLFDLSYKIVPFAGCIIDQQEYINWHAGKKNSAVYNSACDGVGMALRLEDPKTKILQDIRSFLADELFNQTISEKFGLELNLEEHIIDNGIQKYLDGYEISPHPDIRKKAITFMININPHENSEELEHHAHLLEFEPEREYIKHFWAGNNSIDRCLVPWAWGKIAKSQTKNNSLVLFAPSNDTLHAVKASYDHLKAQRTQLYGNIWYQKDQASRKITWENLDIIELHKKYKKVSPVIQNLKSMIPKSVKNFLTSFRKSDQIIASRNKNVNLDRAEIFNEQNGQ